MAVSSGADAIARYKAAMSSQTTQQAYIKGIQGTTVNPMERAAAQEDYYLSRVMAASQSGKRRAALLAANPQTWKDNSVKVGAPRLGTGAAKADVKLNAYVAKYAPVWQQIHDQVMAMPKGGASNAKARAGVAIDAMMAAAGTA